jgi:hypothetical protein
VIVYPWTLISNFCTPENPCFAVGYAPLLTREQKKIGVSYQTPSVLVLLLVVVLVFLLVSCCCRCLHRPCCHVADATDAAVDTKCTATIAIAIAPAAAAIITNTIALTIAIAILVASAITNLCNHCRLAVAVPVVRVVSLKEVRIGDWE